MSKNILHIASAYNRANGLGALHESYAPLDTALAIDTANAYAAMPMYSDTARDAYRAVHREVMAQYRALVANGIRMVITEDDPHPNSAAMFSDLAATNSIRVFRSHEPAHSLMSARLNTIFRFVHDIFGHAARGYQFGPRGEYNAALHHLSMFTPLAQHALLTETHGQNSYVNFGPDGEHNRANPSDTRYAPQKAALLPTSILDRVRKDI